MRYKVVLLPSRDGKTTKKTDEGTSKKQLFSIIHKQPLISKEDGHPIVDLVITKNKEIQRLIEEFPHRTEASSDFAPTFHIIV